MKNIVATVKPDMKRLMMAVAMTAFVISSAHAAELRSESRVSGDVVTVGDLFDGVTAHADHVLAPAPAAGKALTLNAGDLKRVSDAFQLGWQPATGFEQIVVRRSAQLVDSFEIQSVLQERLAQEAGERRYEMEMADRNVSISLPENAAATVEVEKFSYDPSTGVFKAVLAAPSVAAALSHKDVTGRLYPLASVPVLKKGLSAGDIIGASDIEYVDMREKDVSPNVVRSADKLEGMSPRRGMGAGKPVTSNDIEMPMMVKKGQMVTMVLKNNMIHLTTQGRALTGGAEGDVVRIMNTSSNQVIEGVVSGAQTVSVQGPSMIASN